VLILLVDHLELIASLHCNTVAVKYVDFRDFTFMICLQTVIHESLEDVGDESTRVFPENTQQRYQNMKDEDLPKTGLIKKEGPDGSWMVHHTPVAVEVLPVCRATQGDSHTKPKCCIEYVSLNKN